MGAEGRAEGGELGAGGEQVLVESDEETICIETSSGTMSKRTSFVTAFATFLTFMAFEVGLGDVEFCGSFDGNDADEFDCVASAW